MGKKIIITESMMNKIVESVNTHGVLNKIFISYGNNYDPNRPFEYVDPENEWSKIINKPVGGI